MKIHYIDTPLFLYNGEKKSVDGQMFITFSQIDDYIKKYEDEFGINEVEMVIYSITNVGADNNLIINMHDNKPILIVRFQVIKSIKGAKVEPYIWTQQD